MKIFEEDTLDLLEKRLPSGLPGAEMGRGENGI